MYNLENYNFKQCPKCSNLVELTGNETFNITCGKCDTEFEIEYNTFELNPTKIEEMRKKYEINMQLWKRNGNERKS